MKERILKFLSTENKSSSGFAQEIGVQPSSISHILSGRNKPSLDFVIRMLEKYPRLRTEWLIFGRGEMFSESDEPILEFNGHESAGDQTKMEKPAPDSEPAPDSGSNSSLNGDFMDTVRQKDDIRIAGDNNSDELSKRAAKIIILYSDGSFSEYKPS